MGARAEQDDVIFGFFLGGHEGHDASEGREVVIGVHDDGRVDGGEMREEGGAVDEGETVVGEVDGAIVIAREELELGHDHGGGQGGSPRRPGSG